MARSAATHHKSREDSRNADLSWASVLVVDDDASNRDILARRLGRLGCRVLLAEDGAQALEQLRTWDFDLVLLDIMMPGMSGFDVLERRREEPRLMDIPFIVVSALDEIDSVVHGIELGAEDYLPKPFDPVLLRARIGACLEKKLLRDQDKRQTYTIQAQSAALAEWNRTLESRVAAQLEVLKESEERLRQAQKMEAIGLLAGGIAHDFNNLLTATIGFSELVAARLPQGSPLLPYLNEIGNAGRRASSLTQQLLAFSRKQVLQPEVLDLNSVVGEVANLLQRVIGEDLELVISTAPQVGHVKADRGQVDQVILNLAVNARDAMPDGGRLTIETAEVDAAACAKYGTEITGPLVMLTVSDTGLGMDAHTLEHVFEPFFTTKEPGKGTGLGLATVYGIVKQSGGDVVVQSTPGAGSVFRVLLPRIDEPLTTPSHPPIPVEATGGTETVLLVEDQPSVRTLARVALESMGYSVLEAAGPDEALAISQAFSGPIDVLVTDVVMPVMSGRNLAQRLTGARPTLKTLFVSGYSDDEALRRGASGQGISYLQKPFTPNTLAHKVRHVLDAATV